MRSLIRIYDRVCQHACSDKVSISINLNNTIIFFFHVLKAWNAVIISKLANFKCKKVTTRKTPKHIHCFCTPIIVHNLQYLMLYTFACHYSSSPSSMNRRFMSSASYRASPFILIYFCKHRPRFNQI